MKITHSLILIALGGVAVVTSNFAFRTPQESEAGVQPIVEASTIPSPPVLADLQVDGGVFGHPISNPWSRVTKKPFGLHVTPATSPVDQDIFTGFHTGVDFEVSADEQDIDVPINAICSGPLKSKGWVKGYGGIAVQECSLGGEPISVVYGHLKLESIDAVAGQNLIVGQQVGVLGQGYTHEADGRRKHLHLGVYKSSTVNVRGYIAEEEELVQWVDVLKYMKK